MLCGHLHGICHADDLKHALSQAEQAQQDMESLKMQLEAAEAAVNTERQAAATMWAQVRSMGELQVPTPLLSSIASSC